MRTERTPDPAEDRPDDDWPEIEAALARYLDRLNAGEPLDPARVLAENPRHGPRILESLEDFIGLSSQGEEARLGVLGDYTLRRQIGRGGMGVVYEAWENSMDRRVALKVLPTGIAADGKACTRFLREAQTAGKLIHQNIVGVYSTGVKEGTPWYSMEYVEGETLAHMTAKVRDAAPDTETPFGKKDDGRYFMNLAEAFADVADGLQHAHSRGVIHRDIKPSNLILDAEGDRGGRLQPERSGGRPPRLRILDFGLAHLEGQESLTVSGDFVGTPLYMSPEQARRKKLPVDRRTDVYSLGVTMYEALTGQTPFRGTDHADTLSQIIQRDPRPPGQLNPKVPRDLETVVLKCLRKDAGDRYGTAEALGQDLRRFVRGDAIEAQAESLWEKTARRLWKQRRLSLAVSAVLIVAVAAFAVGNVLIARARDQAVYDRYVSDMRLAIGEWEVGNIKGCKKLLGRYAPETGLDHLRGWEWRYVRSLLHTELVSLEGHSDLVRSLDWSPDGRLLASGGLDGAVFIWVGDTGDLLRRLVPGGPPVMSVKWSPDGTALAIATTESFVRVLDPTTGQEVFAHEGTGGARCVDWSPNGDLLASGGEDGTVRVFDREGLLQETLVFPHADQSVVGVEWSPQGDRLAAGSRWPARTVIWSAETWTLSPATESTRVLQSLSWSSNDRLAIAGSDQTVRIWNPTTRTEVEVLEHADEVLVARWSASGDRLASGCTNGFVCVWDTTVGGQPLILRGHEGRVWAVAWNDDRYLATGGQDGTVRIWDTSKDQRAIRLEGEHPAAWSPDGRFLAAEYREARRVNVLSARSLEIEGSVEHGLFESTLAFSPQGQRLAIPGPGRKLRLWDWQAGVRVSTGTEDELAASGLSWAPDGRLAGASGGGAWVWDRRTAQVLRFSTGHPYSDTAVAWSPAGDRLATTGIDGMVRIWLAHNGEPVHELRRARSSAPPVGGSRHHALAWNPAGTRVATGSVDGELVVFDALSGQEEIREAGHSSQVRSVAWSPDGQRIATGSNDGLVKIWDANTGAELVSLRGHEFVVWSLAWSPDGQRLLSAHDERDGLRIWDASAGYDE